MGRYYNNHTTLELLDENYKLKDLLARALSEIRMRVKTLEECWPGPEIRHLIRRNEHLLIDIERALEDRKVNDPS